MPVLFQFPRSTRSSKARPLHSAMRKSGAKSIRRRMKTVHFASTKLLLSAPRSPPTLPLIPYDTYPTNTHTHTQPSHHAHSLHVPHLSHDSGTTVASSGGPHTPSSSSSPYHRTGASPHTNTNPNQHLSPDLIAYYQPSSSTLKPLPATTAPKVVHAETVPLDVDWDGAWAPEPEPGTGRVVRRGRERIPREKLPKTPHPRKAIDLGMQMPGASMSGGGDSYFPRHGGYTVSEVEAADGDGERGRDRSRRREMLDRLRGRSRSRSQQPAPLPHQPQSHVHTQNGTSGGAAFLQVPQRQRHGSFSSSGSGPQMQMQMSSSAPTASYMNVHMRPSAHGPGQGQGQGQMGGQMGGGYVYPPPSPAASGRGTRSRASSLNIHSHPHPHTSHQHSTHQHQHSTHPAQPHQNQHQHQHPNQHQNQHQHQTHHPHHSASAYPAPPPNVRRRSHSNPPEGRYAYAPSPTTPTSPNMPIKSYGQSHSQGHSYTPQVQSASPLQYLNVPTSGSGRKRAGSFSYGAPPPPLSPSHASLGGKARPVASAGAHSSSHAPHPPPNMLRRRTASNPHLPSAGRQYNHQSSLARYRALHRYLAVPSTFTSSSHSSHPHPAISWDIRLPPSTATRTRGVGTAKQRRPSYLSAQALAEPATDPPCAVMRVSATRVYGGGGGGGTREGGSGAREGGTREPWPWPIAIYPQDIISPSPSPSSPSFPHTHAPPKSKSKAVTLNDVLHAVHAALRTRASEEEYERLLPGRGDKRAVSVAYEGRWREESRVGVMVGHSHNACADKDKDKDRDKKAGVGLRRVDFLRGRTVFVGLEPVSGGGGEGEWCLVVM